MKQQIVKKAAHTKNYNRGGEGLPTIIDMDTLACMSDEELMRLHSHTQNEKDRAGRRDDLVIAWETEACYAQRELQIRADRRRAHDAFLRSNTDSAFDYNDSQFESGDFDQAVN